MSFGNSILSVPNSCVTSNVQSSGISMGFNSNDFFKGVSDIKFGELDRLLARNQEQQVTTKMFEESGENEDNAIEYFNSRSLM